MKMVKSLLLGSAAGIVAIAGAQAADLPVKAKPVEYVKICSMYGAGFYYIPGTDTCLKVGGQVFAEWNFNAGGGHGPYLNVAPGRDTRAETPAYATRSRAIATFDARTQTEYGTLRSYISAGWEQNSGDANYRGICFFSRAFIQFAGITAGKTRSFFTFYGNALNYSTLQGGGHSDAGLNLIAYTAQMGGGFSATLSIEDGTHHRTGIWNAEGNPLLIGAIAGSANTTGSAGVNNAEGNGLAGPGSYAAKTFPDIVGQLNISQPWGQAQIMAAVRDTSGSFHGNERMVNGSQDLSQVGFAVGGGVMFNLPWAQGDQLWIQGTYTRGASNYLGFNPFVHTGGSAFAMYSGSPGAGCQDAGGTATTNTGCGNIGMAWAMDGLYDQADGGRMELVEGWSVLAAIQHFWTPALRTSVFGHYTAVRYGNEGREIFCDGIGNAGQGGIVAFNAASANGCNPDFDIWQIGTRTVWSPVRNLDIGLEFLYSRLDQKFDGTWVLPAGGARPAGQYEARDQDHFSGNIRITRSFWP